MRTEPKVICRYATLASSVVLADVATFLKALSIRDTMRVVTELLEVVEALRAWCAETGVVIVREDESRVLTRGGCITEYELDLQRQPPLS
jgi:hypothetical protein